MNEFEDFGGMTEAQLDVELAKQELGLPLSELWAPRDGMVERVTTRTARRVANREAFATLSDLLLLGWHTATAIVDDKDED